MEDIPKLDELLKPVLGKDVQITKCATKSLIAPGENYGSLMLAVDLVLNDSEDLHLVAKMCPLSDFIKQMFNVVVTFKKEVELYKTIVPSMQNFQKRNGCTPIGCFAKYYGSRYSLDPAKTDVDEGCCFLLENIKVKGFGIGDRMRGFDSECTEFLIKDLATFHAVPVAMKLKEPERFKNDVYKHIATHHYTKETITPETNAKMIDELIRGVRAIDKYKPHISTIEKMMYEQAENIYVPDSNAAEPFRTLIHSDYWTNNTMIKFDPNGKIVANCIVDFQMLLYGSPVTDLMFFLFSSVQIPVLRENYKKFLDLYYETFVKVLKDLQVNNLEQFSKDLFLKEINRVMKRLEMFHSLFMLLPIYTSKEKATELADLDQNSIMSTDKLDTEKFNEKVVFLLDQFVQNGWLQL